MYSHTFFVTSVRANDLAPQIAAKASLRLFFAKMPLLAFFMASTFFLAVSDCAFSADLALLGRHLLQRRLR